ncbi:winged helix-turn-helix transcriptional regulator [Deinococcus sp. A31D244]|uniref:winged helix-turn-helix transcriptional regulator n=1 Tax=Deinococcus sp. A31D244 TaxID=3397675 RepID=UPI0039E0EABC
MSVSSESPATAFHPVTERLLTQLQARHAFRILLRLCQGERRFEQLRQDLGNVSSATLTLRLKELQRVGWVMKNGSLYGMTPNGLGVHPIAQAAWQWGTALGDRGEQIYQVFQRTGSVQIMLALQDRPHRAYELRWAHVSRRSVMMRLQELVSLQIITHVSHPDGAAYALTAEGERFRPVTTALFVWLQKEAHAQSTGRR